MGSESFLAIIGIVLIIEGMPWFLSPHGTKRMLTELFRLHDSNLRIVGLVFMLLGLFLVYLAKT